MQLNLVEGASSEIITLKQTKNYLRVDHDFDDDLIKDFIKSTREAIEAIIQTSLMRQVWEYKLHDYSVYNFDFAKKSDFFSVFDDSIRIPLPKPPIMKIISVLINNKKTENCSLEIIDQKFCLCIQGKSAFRNRRKISIDIVYEAGISNNVENIPYQLKLANLMLVANAYNERFSIDQDGIISNGVKQLLSPFLKLSIM